MNDQPDVRQLHQLSQHPAFPMFLSLVDSHFNQNLVSLAQAKTWDEALRLQGKIEAYNEIGNFFRNQLPMVIEQQRNDPDTVPDNISGVAL